MDLQHVQRQVLNSFEKDMYMVDYRSSHEISALLGKLLQFSLIVVITAKFASSPFAALCAGTVLLTLYVRLAKVQWVASNKLHRLVPLPQVPPRELANSVASGLVTVRAFGQTRFYTERLYELFDDATKLGLHLSSGLRWVRSLTDLIGAPFVTMAALALVWTRADAAAARFCITLRSSLPRHCQGCSAR